MKIGFIGAGNMASAMIGGMIRSKIMEPQNIIASALTDSTLNKVKSNFNIETTKNSKELVKRCEVVVIAVKPNVYDSVLEEVKEYITNEKIIITIAAGKTIKSVEDIIGSDKKIVRTMPNTPAFVNEAMSAICPNKNISKEELDKVIEIFSSFGKCEVIDENLIDAVIGVSGSSPAYVFMFIEALADGAVKNGMSRDKAYKFAAQSVMGAAKMVLESKKHPGELKDMVCSPGGTTIEAVSVLEEENMRSSVIKAVNAAVEKSKSMSLN